MSEPEPSTFSASIKDLLASTGGADSKDKGVVPLLSELADKHEQSSVLIQKSMLMLGLANKFKGTDRGKQLQNDAEEFLSYAHQLQNSDKAHEVVERAQSFANTVTDKYEKHGKQLFEQTQHVWDDVMASGEAKDFLSAGSSILNDWDKYGGSAEGKAVIDNIKTHVMSVADNKGASLLDLVNQYSGDAACFLDNADRHKATLMGAVDEMGKLIEEDDELREWMAKGQELVRDRVGQVQERVAGMDKDEMNAKADDTLGNFAAQGQQALSRFQESDMGRDLLKRGTHLLTDLQSRGELSPAVLMEYARRLREEPESRAEMVSKIKDVVLEYLLDFIPKIRLDDLKGENDAAKFEFHNVDLQGFQLRSKDVDVTLVGHTLNIRARNITCHLKDIKWWTKAKTFPYMSSGGNADAVATGCSFEMQLSVDRLLRTAEEAAQAKKAAQEKQEAKGEPSPEAVAAETGEDVDDMFAYDYTVVIVPMEPSPAAAAAAAAAEDDDSEEEWESEPRPTFVRMPYLDVNIGGSWFAGVYNFLLTYFSDFIRGVVQDRINDVILEQSATLVTMVNSAAKEYLPLLAALKDKVAEKAPKFAEVAAKAGKKMLKDGKPAPSQTTVEEEDDDEFQDAEEQ